MTGYGIFTTVLASLTLLSLPFLWRVLRIDGRECSSVDVPTSVPVTADSRPSVIYLQHHGDLYPVADIWEAIVVSRTLAQIDRLPEVA